MAVTDFKPVLGAMALGTAGFTPAGDGAAFCGAILNRAAGGRSAWLGPLTYALPAQGREGGGRRERSSVEVKLLMQLRASCDQNNIYLRTGRASQEQIMAQLKQSLARSDRAVRAQAGEIERAVRASLFQENQFKRALARLEREIKKNGGRPGNSDPLAHGERAAAYIRRWMAGRPVPRSAWTRVHMQLEPEGWVAIPAALPEAQKGAGRRAMGFRAPAVPNRTALAGRQTVSVYWGGNVVMAWPLRWLAHPMAPPGRSLADDPFPVRTAPRHPGRAAPRLPELARFARAVERLEEAPPGAPPSGDGPGARAPAMIYRSPAPSETRALPAQEGESILAAQASPRERVEAISQAFSHTPQGAAGRGETEPPAPLEPWGQDAGPEAGKVNYSRLTEELLVRIERRLRAERRKFGL